MRIFFKHSFIQIFFTITLLLPTISEAQPIPVELIQTEDGNWQLLRDGEPFRIKGAGGTGSMELLAASGANTLRTWGVDGDFGSLLDQAHEAGLTVIVGHWLGHPRHGFDYNNIDMVAEQFERVKRDVLRFKDHPAVLLWGIGNEMEGFENGDNAAVWSHIQALAAMIKEIDPLHPTMTVTAEIGGSRVQAIHQITEAIDIHGINSYGGFPSVLDRYKEQGGTKPVLITEFGPPGTWEVGSNEFGAPLELTSTEKAAVYSSSYINGCLAHPDLCLGGLAFTWGSKMEATATWFGMFLPSGEKLSAVDAMTNIWSGQLPKNLSPEILRFQMEGNGIYQAGETVNVDISVNDPEGANLTFEWIVRAEASEYFTGGDVQAIPVALDGVVQETSTSGASLIMPGAGVYRLYMTVYDGNGAAAVANVPFKVEGEPEQVRVQLPLKVYADESSGYWSPSGWMGNTSKLEVDYESEISPHSGEHSMEISYEGFDNWVGVAWQHPTNDWGEMPGGYDLTGAEKLTFWARGKKGGERIDFGVGILGEDRTYFDTAMAELKGTKLSDSWKQYTINLEGKDLSRIKTPFVWSLSSPGLPVTFYLDDIQFE